MTKSASAYSALAKQMQESDDQRKPMANMAPVANPFNSIFDIQPLDKDESNKIEKILADGYIPNRRTEEETGEDAKEIKRLTSEIKAIGKQGTVLLAERAAKGREILKEYKDGAFNQWIETAFGSRQTGFNLLAYWDLYDKLSLSEKECLKKIPLKSAYRLAARKGDEEIKKEIIRDYHASSNTDLLAIMQEFLPLDSKDKRQGKSPIQKLIETLEKTVLSLESKKEFLSEDDKFDLKTIKNRIEAIL